MANSNGFMDEMKKNTKEFIEERVEKSKVILKLMPPPKPSPASTQSSMEPKTLYSQMYQEQLDIETHKTVMSMFGFAKSLARAINGGGCRGT